MIRHLAFLFVSLFFLLFTSPVWAAENWVIDNFQSHISIQDDGKIEVTEAIDVDFGSAKHGIFRDIPNIYYTDTGKDLYTQLEILTVLQDGLIVNYQSSQNGNFIRLKIGDPNKTISGKRSYLIKYSVLGVLRSFDDHDELYWDVTGNGWSVPILKSSATITLPQAGIIKISCFEGVIGSTKLCISNLSSNNRASFQSSQILQPSEGLTAVVAYTKGLIPILTVTPPLTATYTPTDLSGYPPNGWIFLISSLLGIGLIFWWWKRTGQEQPRGAVVVEYSTPDNLRPAEAGTLLDERADTLDVSATIVDLAIQGFLTIEEKDKKWLFGSTDYIFTRTAKDETNLLNYENELLARIFAEGDVVELSGLKDKFYDDLAEVKQELYQDVVNKKYFPSNPEKVKSKYMLLGGVVVILSFIITSTGWFEPSGILSGFGLALVIVGFVLLIFSRSFPKRTPLGNQTFGKVLGFKLFMEKVETYKQRFMEKENLFNDLLPYAIVFGVTEKFAKAFKDLGLKPSQPTWYKSQRPFNPIFFSSSITNFSNSVTSAIASQPSSKHSFASSGSGFSGGSSGGGSGGGGGGSW